MQAGLSTALCLAVSVLKWPSGANARIVHLLVETKRVDLRIFNFFYFSTFKAIAARIGLHLSQNPKMVI
jgi:hypothetical protein